MAVGLVLWACSGALALADPVTEFQLPNGLKVLVKPDHRAPVVTSQIWYKVGSSYESSGYTGISHVLEHMMFKGTPKTPPGRFSRIIAEQGGRDNAFTSRDYTAYFQQLSADRLPISFALESDRMKNLLLREEDFRKEVEVVKEERRMRTENQPRARTDEMLMATAFVASGYHHPVIGWMGDLDSLKVSDLRPWYQRFYSPNNATLVVVGDVQPQAVKALAEKYYGPIKPSTLPEIKPRPEPEQAGERLVKVRAPAQIPYLLMGYHVPRLTRKGPNEEAYALEVLAGLLSSGKSARLDQNLVRGSQVASGVEAGYELVSRDPGLFYLGGTPANGKSNADLRKALEAEIRKLQEQPVNPAELEKVKAQLAAGETFSRDSGFYQAMQLGTYETVGLDWRQYEQYVPAIRAVTPAQVQAVARKYLVDSNRTVAELDPLPPVNPQANTQGAPAHAH
ncbi:pitrilysin family protein [Thermithiobacillus plumbiphilus]|uniref:Pitrilysin family protein n=1 Tax=Thermithiobacillus plumbiphilus TaxID=1729899 RepID=A0ABU9DAP3_9PROT